MQLPTLSMYGEPLDYVDRYKYLGLTVVSGDTFTTSHFKPLIRFCSTSNTVLKINQRPSKQIFMKMLFATCVPHLMYASDVVQYWNGQMQQLDVALNDCITHKTHFYLHQVGKYSLLTTFIWLPIIN